MGWEDWLLALAYRLGYLVTLMGTQLLNLINQMGYRFQKNTLIRFFVEHLFLLASRNND